MENTKKTIGIALIAIAVIFLASGAFSGVIFSSVDIARSCDYAVEKYTAGATQGECFVSSGPSSVTGVSSGLKYVSSVIESTRSGPTGVEPFCKIDYTSSTAETLTCSEAKTFSSTTSIVKVCSDNSECDNNMCVNHLCRIALIRDCITIGEYRCNSETEYQKCLLSYKWSGNLYCQSGTSCSLTGCISNGEGPICGDEVCGTKESSTCPSDCQWTNPLIPGFTNQQLLFGGLGLIGLVLLLKQ